jgi:pimeloyl-ACP methyl ester carboxylesterase
VRARKSNVVASVAASMVMACLLTACAAFARSRTPMLAETHPNPGHQRAACLLVMLPGYGDEAADFEEHGFLDAVRRAHVDADVTSVEAHYGYYRDHTIVSRLHEDILAPARQQGYRRIVLVGISMGGLGAVATARLHPEDVDALVLLAPYLGDADVVGPVDRQGLPAYVPPNPNDFFQQNWVYLAGYAKHAERPPMLLGYGTSDRLARELELLRPYLPRERVTAVPGSHAWKTWSPIFDRWADGGALESFCAGDVANGT